VQQCLGRSRESFGIPINAPLAIEHLTKVARGRLPARPNELTRT
jgi:hypothetical protein